MQPCSDYDDHCSNVVYQTVDVGLPISLIPTVGVGDIRVMCSGEPRVELCRCDGFRSGLELEITQTITYRIPIEYCAEASAGEVKVECKKNSSSVNSDCTQYSNPALYSRS